MLEPDAVTMRPEMGSAQLEHDTVGIAWRESQGRRPDELFWTVGLTALLAEEGWGSGLVGRLISPCTLIVGTDGWRGESSFMLITGICGSSSGRFIVGTAGADNVNEGTAGFGD